MITTVVLGGTTIKCNLVNKPKGANVRRITIPGRDGQIIQNLGNLSKVITLRGILSGATKDTDKATLEGFEGTVTTYNDGVDNINVAVESVVIPTEGGNPNHYIFEIICVEYDQV